MQPTTELKNGVLTIRIPVDSETVSNARLSSTGKMRLVASFSERVGQVDGHPLRLQVNLMRPA